MNYKRDWNNRCNAAGFAAECARLALPFYSGDRRSDLVAAIEIAEHYANGEQIENTVAHVVAADANAAANAAASYAADAVASYASYAAAAAAEAAYAAAGAYDDAANDADAAADAYAYDAAAVAADYADLAGVDSSEIQIAFARWVIRDLSGDQDLDEELRQAAGAAIVAGDEDLARQLVQGSE